MPAWVLAAPASLKVTAATAPASCMARVSRISDTPVSLAAATRSPLRESPRTSSVAATVLPAFMQVPAMYTTGASISSTSLERDGAIPDVRRAADAVAQRREGEHRAKHLGRERRADVGIGGGAAAEHPAEVEDVDGVADGDMRRYLAGVTAKRAAAAQRPGKDVALAEGHEPTGEVFHGVVRRLVGQQPDGQHVAPRPR